MVKKKSKTKIIFKRAVKNGYNVGKAQDMDTFNFNLPPGVNLSAVFLGVVAVNYLVRIFKRP